MLNIFPFSYTYDYIDDNIEIRQDVITFNTILDLLSAIYYSCVSNDGIFGSYYNPLFYVFRKNGVYQLSDFLKLTRTESAIEISYIIKNLTSFRVFIFPGINKFMLEGNQLGTLISQIDTSLTPVPMMAPIRSISDLLNTVVTNTKGVITDIKTIGDLLSYEELNITTNILSHEFIIMGLVNIDIVQFSYWFKRIAEYNGLHFYCKSPYLDTVKRIYTENNIESDIVIDRYGKVFGTLNSTLELSNISGNIDLLSTSILSDNIALNTSLKSFLPSSYLLSMYQLYYVSQNRKISSISSQISIDINNQPRLDTSTIINNTYNSQCILNNNMFEVQCLVDRVNYELTNTINMVMIPGLISVEWCIRTSDSPVFNNFDNPFDINNITYDIKSVEDITNETNFQIVVSEDDFEFDTVNNITTFGDPSTLILPLITINYNLEHNPKFRRFVYLTAKLTIDYDLFINYIEHNSSIIRKPFLNPSKIRNQFTYGCKEKLYYIGEDPYKIFKSSYRTYSLNDFFNICQLFTYDDINTIAQNMDSSSFVVCGESFTNNSKIYLPPGTISVSICNIDNGNISISPTDSTSVNYSTSISDLSMTTAFHLDSDKYYNIECSDDEYARLLYTRKNIFGLHHIHIPLLSTVTTQSESVNIVKDFYTEYMIDPLYRVSKQHIDSTSIVDLVSGHEITIPNNVLSSLEDSWLYIMHESQIQCFITVDKFLFQQFLESNEDLLLTSDYVIPELYQYPQLEYDLSHPVVDVELQDIMLHNSYIHHFLDNNYVFIKTYGFRYLNAVLDLSDIDISHLNDVEWVTTNNVEIEPVSDILVTNDDI